MLSRLFQILNSSNAVKAVLGNNPLRVFPYGVKLNAATRKPYALYGVFNGEPYNYLADRSDMDLSGLQVDIYAETSQSAQGCFNAIRDAVENYGYITSFSTENIDIEDGLYHVRIDIDLHEER